MKKILAVLLALVLVLTAFASCTKKPAEPGNEGKTEPADTPTPVATATDGLNVCIASEPDTIDPALNSAVDGVYALPPPSGGGIFVWREAVIKSFCY